MNDLQTVAPRTLAAATLYPPRCRVNRMHVLVLHGPNLNLLGAKLDSLNAGLLAHAKNLGFELEVFQANSEGALIDELHRRREWFDAVIVNPAALAPIAYALAEALELINKKCIEVQLISGRASVLREVVRAQFHGDEAVYEQALDTLAGKRAAEKIEEEKDELPRASSRLGKSIGRRVSPAANASTASQGPRKTIGRTMPPVSPKQAPLSTGPAITRALVKAQVQARLSGTLPSDALASWARTQWQALTSGNSQIEAGQKDLLEDVLLSLSASAKANDHVLLTAVARLDR